MAETRPVPDSNLFKDHPGATFAPPWEAFWDCPVFASDDCPKNCEKCNLHEEKE